MPRFAVLVTRTFETQERDIEVEAPDRLSAQGEALKLAAQTGFFPQPKPRYFASAEELPPPPPPASEPSRPKMLRNTGVRPRKAFRRPNR